MSNNSAEIFSSRLHGFRFPFSADRGFLSSVVDDTQRRTLHTPAVTVRGGRDAERPSSYRMKSLPRSHLLFCRRFRSVVQVMLVPARTLACQLRSAHRNGTSMATQLLSELWKVFINRFSNEKRNRPMKSLYNLRALSLALTLGVHVGIIREQSTILPETPILFGIYGLVRCA
jgi:hypothetical protein